LVVIGDDKHRSQYLKLCSSLGIDERVFFAGVRQVSKDLYEQFDALVLPTAYDPFPNVIAESLVSGTRVITTCHCGGQDFADDESVLIADNQAELIDLFRSNSFDKKLSAGLIAKYRKVFSRENLRVLILEMINDSGLTYRIE
jgi:glycosyltransferase involved in cell wall biosynthesis